MAVSARREVFLSICREIESKKQPDKRNKRQMERRRLIREVQNYVMQGQELDEAIEKVIEQNVGNEEISKPNVSDAHKSIKNWYTSEFGQEIVNQMIIKEKEENDNCR